MDKASKKRISILKPEKSRPVLADVVFNLEKEKAEEPEAATRRVRFSSNFVKPFSTDDNKTIWDNTYEEEIEKSEESGPIRDNCTFNYTKQSESSKSLMGNYGRTSNDFFKIAPKNVASESYNCADDMYSIFHSRAKNFRTSDLHNTTIAVGEADESDGLEFEKTQIMEVTDLHSEVIKENLPQAETIHIPIMESIFKQTEKINNRPEKKLLADPHEISKKLLLSENNLSNITKKSVLFQHTEWNKENPVVSKPVEDFDLILSVQQNNADFRLKNSNTPGIFCEENKNLNQPNRRTIIFNQDDDECNMDLDLTVGNGSLIEEPGFNSDSPKFNTDVVKNEIISERSAYQLPGMDLTNINMKENIPIESIADVSHSKFNVTMMKDMEFTCNMKENIPFEIITDVSRSEFNFTTMKDMEFTCNMKENIPIENVSDVSNSELNVTAMKDMEFTCQVPLNIIDKDIIQKSHNANMFGKKCFPSNTTHHILSSDEMNKSKYLETIMQAKSFDKTDSPQCMEFTCQAPPIIFQDSASTMQNIRIIGQNHSRVNDELSVSPNMEFTCQARPNMFHELERDKFNVTHNMEFTCQAVPNMFREKLSDELNVTPNMEFTCKAPPNVLHEKSNTMENIKIISSKLVSASDELNATSNMKSSSCNESNVEPNMEFTCQALPNRLQEKPSDEMNVTPNMEFTCQALPNRLQEKASDEMNVTPNMEFACQAPTSVLQENIRITSYNPPSTTDNLNVTLTLESSSCNESNVAPNMEFTCQALPKILQEEGNSMKNIKIVSHNNSGSADELNISPNIEFTCQFPLNIAQQKSVLVQRIQSTNSNSTSSNEPTNLLVKEKKATLQSINPICSASSKLDVSDELKFTNLQNLETTCDRIKKTESNVKSLQSIKSPCISSLNINKKQKNNISKSLEFTSQSSNINELKNNKNSISQNISGSNNDDNQKQTSKIPIFNKGSLIEITNNPRKIIDKSKSTPNNHISNKINIPQNQTMVSDNTETLGYETLNSSSYNRPGIKIICTKPQSQKMLHCKRSFHQQSKTCEPGCTIHQESPFVKKKETRTYEVKNKKAFYGLHNQEDGNTLIIPETVINPVDEHTCQTEIAPILVDTTPNKTFASILQELKVTQSPSKFKKVLDFENNILAKANQDDSLGLINVSLTENSQVFLSSLMSDKRNTPKSDFSKILNGECVEDALIDPNLMILSSSGNSFDIDSSGLNILNNTKNESIKIDTFKNYTYTKNNSKHDKFKTSLKVLDSDKSITTINVTNLNQEAPKVLKDESLVSNHTSKIMESFLDKNTDLFMEDCAMEINNETCSKLSDIHGLSTVNEIIEETNHDKQNIDTSVCNSSIQEINLLPAQSMEAINKLTIEIYADSYLKMFDDLSVDIKYKHIELYLNQQVSREEFNDNVLPVKDLASSCLDYISILKEDYRNAVDEKENIKSNLSLEGMSVYERVLEHINLDTNSFNKIACEENKFVIKTFRNMIEVTAFVDCIGTVVEDISVTSLLNDKSTGLDKFLLNIFIEKLEKKLLISSVGENFSIFTLVDYLSLQCQNIFTMKKEFLQLGYQYGLEMDKDLMARCTFVYMKLEIAFTLLIDCSDFHKIGHERLTITEKLGMFSDFEILKISKLCPTGFQFLNELIKKVDKHYKCS